MITGAGCRYKKVCGSFSACSASVIQDGETESPSYGIWGITAKGLDRSPVVLSVSAYNNQQHFAYTDSSYMIWDAWWGTRRQFHRLNPDVGEHLQELRREQWIAIMDQVPLCQQIDHGRDR